MYLDKMVAIGPNEKQNITKNDNTQRSVIVELMFRYTLRVRSIMKKYSTLVLEQFSSQICNL